jgi:DNA modification methylase
MEYNYIKNIDCFSDEGLKAIPSKSIKLIITDPPYLHNKGGGTNIGTNGNSIIGNNNPMYSFDSPMMHDMSSFGENEINILLDEFKRLQDKIHCYIFCNDTQLPYYMNWCLKNKKRWIVLTWEKPLTILNRNRFSLNLEYIIRIYEQGSSINKLDIDKYPEKKEYYSRNRKIPQVKSKDKIHPVQKPLEYIKNLIELSSNEGDVILDPFIGGGTIPVACKELNRNYIGFEKDEGYYNKSIIRINNTENKLKE